MADPKTAPPSLAFALAKLEELAKREETGAANVRAHERAKSEEFVTFAADDERAASCRRALSLLERAAR